MTAPQAPTRRGPILRYGPIALIAAIMVLGYGVGLHKQVSMTMLMASRTNLIEAINAHPALAVLAYAGVYIVAVCLSVPGAGFLSMSGGFLLGVMTGAITTLCAATIGATLVFLAARSAFAETLCRQAGPKLNRILCGFRADGFSYLLFLRLVPIFPFWLVNIAPALAGLRLSTFVAATLIGILPGTIAFSVIGSGLDGVIAAQIAANPACANAAPCTLKLDPKALVTPKLIAGLVGLGLVALLPIAWRLTRRRRPAVPS